MWHISYDKCDTYDTYDAYIIYIISMYKICYVIDVNSPYH